MLLSIEALMYERYFGSKNKQANRSTSESTSSNASSQSSPPPSISPAKRDYRQVMHKNTPVFTFGCEGHADGQFSRPWGICCDKLGRILVADRSNNRIQIFNPNGEFIMKFGTEGNRTGEFNRPAGITVNSQNNIIVADKDNHRVQVFNEQGVWISGFGANGRQIGLFNYPWDVACNSRDDIAVSDTRNHRVQIFSKCGQFLRKCTFDAGLMGKNLYSPRGVCYMPDDSLVVTDFNGHRVAVLDVDHQVIKVSFYGTEGNLPGHFHRPQGICLDNDNNLLVADSRCNRVQAFAVHNMRVLAVLDACKGMDRPTDVCVGLDGRIYVVDFGNNCIRVF